MATINVGKSEPFLIEKCDTCQSLFFDPGELEALLDNEVETPTEVNYQLLTQLTGNTFEASVVYRKCPVCSKMMNRVNFGKRSGVVIDRCRDHGIFLDATELRQLMEWKKAGGQIVNQEHQAKLAREKQKQRRDSPQVQHPVTFSDQQVYQSNETGVANLLIGLVGKFFG
jgi:Zn-finger nucleic acid-binding protein